VARAFGSYPKCQRFKSVRRYQPGSIAQLGEHLPYKQGVIGSSPIVPTMKKAVIVAAMTAFFSEINPAICEMSFGREMLLRNVKCLRTQ
jgi:hypothetical protein